MSSDDSPARPWSSEAAARLRVAAQVVADQFIAHASVASSLSAQADLLQLLDAAEPLARSLVQYRRALDDFSNTTFPLDHVPDPDELDSNVDLTEDPMMLEVNDRALLSIFQRVDMQVDDAEELIRLGRLKYLLNARESLSIDDAIEEVDSVEQSLRVLLAHSESDSWEALKNLEPLRIFQAWTVVQHMQSEPLEVTLMEEPQSLFFISSDPMVQLAVRFIRGDEGA